MPRLASDVKISSAITLTAGAAGATSINGSILDMAGYRGVLIVVTFGAIVGTAVTAIKVQQGNDSGLSDAADLLGSGQTIADTDDDKIFFIDVRQPQERYLRLVVSRSIANATVCATYFQYDGRRLPVAHPAGVAGESWESPAEGTA